MNRNSVRAFSMLLAASLALAALVAQPRASAETDAAGYELVYTADNPVPDIVETARPAVVRVIAMRETWQSASGISSAEIGYGSGVYVDERGYIVTNFHVVENATSVEVQTLSGARFPADEFFVDEGTDLALLRVSRDIGAQPVPIGDSDSLRVGELAIAIGNPGVNNEVFFGTVTVGVVSALDRELDGAGNFTRKVTMVQTDAAINAGNSGGALLNRDGELIGIPTLKISSSYAGAAYEGLGFAIPANTVRSVVSELIERGKVIRPRLGVMGKAVDGAEEPAPGVAPAGVLVDGVEPDSPAERAGLRRYDIVTHVNGVRVKSVMDMTGELSAYAAGDTVKLTVCRFYDAVTGLPLANGETLEIEAALAILDM